MGVFKVFESLSRKNNQSLKLSPLSNMKSACSGKNGWGSVTIAIPNELIGNLIINQELYVGGFIICDRSEFDKEKNLLESEKSS